jgi:hypothetical protein
MLEKWKPRVPRSKSLPSLLMMIFTVPEYRARWQSKQGKHSLVSPIETKQIALYRQGWILPCLVFGQSSSKRVVHVLSAPLTAY